jgi:hypothetical protein
MERILKWILKLEDELDKQDNFASNDLITIKEKFQNHEVKNFFLIKILSIFLLSRNL